MNCSCWLISACEADVSDCAAIKMISLMRLALESYHYHFMDRIARIRLALKDQIQHTIDWRIHRDRGGIMFRRIQID